MAEWKVSVMKFPDRETVARIRAAYPPGTRLELVKMDDAFAPPAGTIGKVVAVDDAGDLCMEWSTGSTLKVILGEDIVKKKGVNETLCGKR